MSTAAIKPCITGPASLQEQFIPDHVFAYLTKGVINCYDGNKSHTLAAGEYCLARKNRLARYDSQNGNEFERMTFCFEEAFLRSFQEKHKILPAKFNSADTFVKVGPTPLIPDFIQSLKPYLDSAGNINAAFEDVKYEELLIILLQVQPELAGIFFDYAVPQKINLEEFMNRNFKFNVSSQRFAWLTGRSISAFKRDFKTIFHQTPNRWLVQRRLQEAYVMIEREHQKAADIYLDLGFEDLSHFLFVFKKQFGLTPTELMKKKNTG